MSADTPVLDHLLLVCLRGQDTAAVVRMASAEHAQQTLLFAAAQFLRKAPNDRAACWLIGSAGEATLVGPEGVGTAPTYQPIAAFDPREVVGVQHVTREREAWKE